MTQRLQIRPQLGRFLWIALVLAAVGSGVFSGHYLVTGAAAAAIVFAWWKSQTPRPAQAPQATAPRPAPAAATRPVLAVPPRSTVPPSDTEQLVEQMLAQGRFALLLRPEIAHNLSPEQFQHAWNLLDTEMALVPAGELLLGFASRTSETHSHDSEDDTQPEDIPPILVDYFHLDRYPVTNRQFQQFVDGGGYEQAAIWEPEILPAVLDFVDLSGTPGPRFWRDGRYPEGQGDYPVVGVSWFEACAYARWVGKRLSTDPEWEKAGSWPLSVAGHIRSQRRFPWGDAMDRLRCNIWGSGPEQLVPVTDFAEGVSVGGVYQLIGNTWEWTTGSFGCWGPVRRELMVSVPMKSVRGGAFDTYFENQASCQFVSGENPISRKHNIGFRCALSTCDLLTPEQFANSAAPDLVPVEDDQELVMTAEVH
jgi:iron(II)-dependent oxidoreductase